MASRLKLQEELEKIVGKVYYNPPKNINMSYPCIRFNLDKIDTNNANDRVYLARDKYNITLISAKTVEGEELMRKLLFNLPRTVMGRAYISDGLHHYAFTHYE